MRRLAAAVVCLGLVSAAAAAAGPIRVEIDAGGAPRDPFLVSVTGHYLDFHNGRSRHWKDALVRADGRHTIALGPVNPLVTMGVSVAVYHPEYVTERARVEKAPLLLRPVGFETFRPVSWRAAIDSGAAFDNGGPRQPLAQVVGHLQTFLTSYLPAVDAAAGGLAVSEASLRSYLTLFEELIRFGDSDGAAVRSARWVTAKMASDTVFARAMAQNDLEARTQLRELLWRAREWLSLPREQRVTVRRFMQDMRYPRTISEALMTPSDHAQIAAFLERYAADRAAGREPATATSWINPDNHIAYRVYLRGTPGECAYLGVGVDLTGVVPADLGDMTHQVSGSFCRQTSGEWRVQPR